MKFWPLERFLYPLDDALRIASSNAGEGKKFRDLPHRPYWRIRIWNASEFFQRLEKRLHKKRIGQGTKD